MFICICPLVEFYTLQISLIECSIICNQPALKNDSAFSWVIFVFFNLSPPPKQKRLISQAPKHINAPWRPPRLFMACLGVTQ